MIKCKNVKFSYYKDEYILQDITFDLAPNKITILLGNNGAGKTTLLNCIDGGYDINSGTIEHDEDCVYIKDNPVLYEYLSGREYIELVLALNDDKNRDFAEKILKDLDMDSQIDKAIIDFSLGMKHKLALISAMVLGYKIYLIDEPLTSLDPTSQRFMINYLKKMPENGSSLLISTHMMHVAYELADEILVLNEGVVINFTNDFETYEDFENYVLNQLSIKIEETK